MTWSLFVIAALAITAHAQIVNQNIVNTDVERAIDLTSQLAKESVTVTVTNKGTSGNIQSYLFTLDPALRDSLSYISADLKQDGGKDTALSVEHLAKDNFYRVQLQSVIAPGDSQTIEINLVYTHCQRPYPTHIKQNERQLVIFKGNHFLYSPYATESQKTTVTLPPTSSSNGPESYSKLKPVSKLENGIEYGPYRNVEPYSVNEMSVHFESHAPFLTVKTMSRLIEVSHWGNIAVEELFVIDHTGAVLKGSFSRFDYQRTKDRMSSVQSFTMILPSLAEDIYYRDEIGNISTSDLINNADSVELKIQPRFPLFGGWNTLFTIGYNLPTYEYLFFKQSDYLLRFRFIDHVFDDYVIDELTVKIILPEGCRDITVDAPYPIHRRKDEVIKTYLDTVGRPVVVLAKSNLVEQHIQDIQIRYKFNSLYLLQEPALLIVGLFVFFLLVIIVVRMDFTIYRNDASEARLKVSGLTDKVLSLNLRRLDNYGKYTDAAAKLKSNKDNQAFQLTKKKLDNEVKSIGNEIAEIIKNIHAKNPEMGEVASALNKKELDYKELINQSLVQAEKVAGGKMTKQHYLEADKTNKERREELRTRISSLASQLS